jgi:hypothetical protein
LTGSADQNRESDVVALQRRPLGSGREVRSMLTRLKNWLQGSRRKSGEPWEADRGHLSEQERHQVDDEEPSRLPAGAADPSYGPQVFDEERRGRPGN